MFVCLHHFNFRSTIAKMCRECIFLLIFRFSFPPKYTIILLLFFSVVGVYFVSRCNGFSVVAMIFEQFFASLPFQAIDQHTAIDFIHFNFHVRSQYSTVQCYISFDSFISIVCPHIFSISICSVFNYFTLRTHMDFFLSVPKCHCELIHYYAFIPMS